MKTDKQIEKELAPLKSLFDHNEYSVTNEGSDSFYVRVNISPEVQVEIRVGQKQLAYLGMEAPLIS